MRRAQSLTRINVERGDTERVQIAGGDQGEWNVAVAHSGNVPVVDFDGDTASAPIACDVCWSKVGFQVTPPSLLFHTPPDAAPA